MSIILGALGGAGKAAGEIADSNIKLWNDQDLLAKRGEIELQREKALQQMKGEQNIATEQRAIIAKNQQRKDMVSDIDKGAASIVAGRMEGHGVSDASTWTPEQEAARTQGMGILQSDPRIRANAAANAGYIDEAGKLDKIAESGASTVPWGSTRVDGDGKVIYDNGADLKGRITQQGADAKTAGGGKKADHFDEKQWDVASKIDKSVVSLPTGLDGKEVESGDLRSTYMKLFNKQRALGDMAPNEAAEYATSAVVDLKNAAAYRLEMARKKDPASKMTLDGAIRDIIREGDAYKPKPATEPQGGGKPLNASEQDMRRQASGDMGPDPKAIARELKKARADLDTVTDEPSKAQLREYIADLEKQGAAIPTAMTASATGAAPAPKVAADSATSPAPEYEALKAQARILDTQIQELRRDYNQATSLIGRRTVDPAVPARIKARIDALVAQQDALNQHSESAYRAADKALVASRGAGNANLNTKYAQ